MITADLARPHIGAIAEHLFALEKHLEETGDTKGQRLAAVLHGRAGAAVSSLEGALGLKAGTLQPPQPLGGVKPPASAA